MFSTTKKVAIISPMMVVNDSTITTCVKVILVHHGVLSSKRSGFMSGDRSRGSMDGFRATGSNGRDEDPEAGPKGLMVALELMDTAGDDAEDDDAALEASFDPSGEGDPAGADRALPDPAVASCAGAEVGAGLFESNALSSSSKSIALRSLSSSRRTWAAPSSKSGSAARTTVLEKAFFRSDMLPTFRRDGALWDITAPCRAAIDACTLNVADILCVRDKDRELPLFWMWSGYDWKGRKKFPSSPTHPSRAGWTRVVSIASNPRSASEGAEIAGEPRETERHQNTWRPACLGCLL